MKTFYLGVLIFLVSPLAHADLTPKSYDWRQVLGGLTPIKNERMCGAPYAFSATTAFETAILIKDGVRVSLSDQELVSCDKEQNQGCAGGYTSLPYLVNHGIALNSTFPYAGTELNCPTDLPVFRKADGWGKLANEEGKDAPSIESVKTAILRYGAVITFVAVTNTWTKYKGGIYDACDGGNSPNHIINLVGWNDEGEYWIARNMWGEVWGEKGYINIKYGCNQVGKEVSYIIYKDKK